MESNVKGLASAFGITFNSATSPSHAVLAKVFLLDDRYVLRGRPLEEQTAADFAEELALLEEVRPLVPFRFPDPLSTKKGKKWIVSDGLLWTVYPQLHGRILGTWQEGKKLSWEQTTKILQTMHFLHDETKGRFAAPKKLWLVEKVQTAFDQDRNVLTETEQQLIAQSIDRINKKVEGMPAVEFCFIHGDCHHGNVLADENGEICALLDLNWCRVGHPLEDLAYSFTMFMSDYDTSPFVFDDDRLQKLITLYNPNLPIDTFFFDLFALATLFDVLLFKALKTQEADFYYEHRLALFRAILERRGNTLCEGCPP